MCPVFVAWKNPSLPEEEIIFWGDRRKRDFLGIEKSCLCRAGRSFSLVVYMADIKQDHGSYVVKAKLEQETKDEAPKVLTGYLRGFMR